MCTLQEYIQSWCYDAQIVLAYQTSGIRISTGSNIFIASQTPWEVQEPFNGTSIDLLIGFSDHFIVRSASCINAIAIKGPLIQQNNGKISPLSPPLGPDLLPWNEPLSEDPEYLLSIENRKTRKESEMIHAFFHENGHLRRVCCFHL